MSYPTAGAADYAILYHWIGFLVAFDLDPWPTWHFELPDGTRILQEVFVEHGTGASVGEWTLVRAAGHDVTLRVRPFLSGRDYHAMHHENGAFRFGATERGASVTFSLYEGLPEVVASSNGEFKRSPDWYRQFLYSAELARGLDAVEDLASPGEFSWRLAAAGDRAVWVLRTAAGADAPGLPTDVVDVVDAARARERTRRDGFNSALDRAADAYVVQRGTGRTIVAGYPSFTDWGRDTFIAIRGLCLATGRLDDARDILVEWAGTVSEGMLPNRFPDSDDTPEFISVDASLWFVSRRTSCSRRLACGLHY
jgi:predicted glycogen debranching enzyme